MKVAILAGGKGSRLAEMTETEPKALVGIGGRPIIWHVMKIYNHFGFDDFVIALGYRGQQIVDFFVESGTAKTLRHLGSDGSCLKEHTEDSGKWSITFIDTGAETQTGERLRSLRPYLDRETFMLTWCDGLADIDIGDLVRFHRRHGRVATVTATHPTPRFGRIELDGDVVVDFKEKAVIENEWINGAYFVFEPSVFEHLEDGAAMVEHDLLPTLAAERQLMAYRHTSFWRCMDTVHEQQVLDAMWRRDTAPWKMWAA
jgi:glucose-1-phosphate cytidylyltransferase